MNEVYVALVTPFLKDYSIDYDALGFLVEKLIEEKCDGFIVCGTTAESCTLTEEEKFSILDFVIKKNQKRTKIFFGCGTNNTLETIRYCRKAQNYDIDGLLIVTPYYNKPTQEGLYQHYATIAENCSLPIILYQVESRCNCIFEIETLHRLVHRYKHIFALKYASSNMEYARKIKESLPSLKLYCGDDRYILESYMLGMDGLISVIGHTMMKYLYEFYHFHIYRNDILFKELSNYLFVETNPIGMKYLLSQKYGMNEEVRLPLTCFSKQHKYDLNLYFDKNHSF